MESLHWDDLQLLLTLIESPSMNQASRRLQISQSTASRRLYRLEQMVGATLFDRTPEGVRPTQLAIELVPFAAEIGAQMDEIRRTTAAMDEEPSGRVKLALPDGIASQLLLPSMGHLTKTFPNIQLDFLTGNVVLDLVRREADIALRFVRPENPDLVCVKLVELKIGAYTNDALSTTPLKDLTWFGFFDPASLFTETHWLEQHISPKLWHRCSSWNTIFAAVQTGIGAAILADVVAMEHGFVRIAKRKARPHPRTLYMVYHAALRNVPKIVAVREWLTMVAKEPPP